MTPQDLATVGYIDEAVRGLLDVVAKLRDEVIVLANRPADDYLTLQQVADLTNTSKRTVEGWIKKGKPGPNGKLVKLPTFRFGDQDRIKRADLEEFGKMHELVGAPHKPAKVIPFHQPQSQAFSPTGT